MKTSSVAILLLGSLASAAPTPAPQDLLSLLGGLTGGSSTTPAAKPRVDPLDVRVQFYALAYPDGHPLAKIANLMTGSKVTDIAPTSDDPYGLKRIFGFA